MARRIPAERFPPAEYIREEMGERGWSVETLAEESGLKRCYVEELLAGRTVTSLAAVALGKAFGTGPELWLNLQAAADAVPQPGESPEGEGK